MTAKKAATTAKHATGAKHSTTSKHSLSKAQAAHLHALHVAHEAHLAHLRATGQPVTVKAAPAKPAKAKKKAAFAAGDWLPVCSFEAVAQSLRLAGQPVSDDEVAHLWELSGSPSDGVSTGEALAAAALFGLGGFRPVALGADLGVSVNPLDPADQFSPDFFHRLHAHDLILHVDVPGPHAVLATPDGWWSWGERYDPWPCQVSEAWAVSWS